MKNKIISGIIAALSLPVYFSLLWAIDQFLLVRIVLVFVMIACMIVSVYKLSKLILDEHFKNMISDENNITYNYMYYRPIMGWRSHNYI